MSNHCIPDLYRHFVEDIRIKGLQLKVLPVIENCRTAALGGHVSACTNCLQLLSQSPLHKM